MNLHSARAILIRDRLDWSQPRLSWLPAALYRKHRPHRKTPR